MHFSQHTWWFYTFYEEHLPILLICVPCQLLGLRKWNPYHIVIRCIFLCVFPLHMEIHYLPSYSNTLPQCRGSYLHEYTLLCSSVCAQFESFVCICPCRGPSGSQLYFNYDVSIVGNSQCTCCSCPATFGL